MYALHVNAEIGKIHCISAHDLIDTYTLYDIIDTYDLVIKIMTEILIYLRFYAIPI